MRYNINSGYGQLQALGLQKASAGKTFYVAAATNPNFDDLQNMLIPDADGTSRFFGTLAQAVAQCVSGRGDVINLFPGTYDESVIVDKDNVTIVGIGGATAVSVAPQSGDLFALNVYANDVTILGVDFAADGTAAFAVNVFGDRFRADGCKFENATNGGATAFLIGPATIAQKAALNITGSGSDSIVSNSEFCWSNDGVILQSSDFGAATENRFYNCRFHNITADEISENDAGGIGSVRSLGVLDCTFDNQEDNTAPTHYVNISSAGSTGMFSRNSFALATNAAAKLAIATDILWVTNGTEAGWSTARPS